MKSSLGLVQPLTAIAMLLLHKSQCSALTFAIILAVGITTNVLLRAIK